MVLSVPVIALGATLGTATSILALCGVTCLCRHMHPKKGLLQREREPDPEKAGVLRSAQQVSWDAGWEERAMGQLSALPGATNGARKGVCQAEVGWGGDTWRFIAWQSLAKRKQGGEGGAPIIEDLEEGFWGAHGGRLKKE